MGDIKVEVKIGLYFLWENDVFFDFFDYVMIDCSNVKWDLKIEWEILFRMDIVGI